MRRALGTGITAGVLIAIFALIYVRGDREGNDRTQPLHALRPVALSCDAKELVQASELEIEADAIRLPTRLQARLGDGADALHERWRAWLNDENLTRPRVRIRFVADPEEYAELYQGPIPAGADTSGFYRMRDNEAVVLYSAYRRQDTLATTLHEMSHIFTAWHLGSMPIWFDEGLAEYFETLNGRGEFPRSAEHIVVLRRDGALPLNTLTELRRSEFGVRDARRHYASAWALVAFLLEHEAGSKILRSGLRRAQNQACEATRDSGLSLAAYPGGLSALEGDLNAWIQTL